MAQWNQQCKEERITEKKYTGLEIYAHVLACLSITEQPMDSQSQTYSWVVLSG